MVAPANCKHIPKRGSPIACSGHMCFVCMERVLGQPSGKLLQLAHVRRLLHTQNMSVATHSQFSRSEQNWSQNQSTHCTLFSPGTRSDSLLAASEFTTPASWVLEQECGLTSRGSTKRRIYEDKDRLPKAPQVLSTVAQIPF